MNLQIFNEKIWLKQCLLEVDEEIHIFYDLSNEILPYQISINIEVKLVNDQ